VTSALVPKQDWYDVAGEVGPELEQADGHAGPFVSSRVEAGELVGRRELVRGVHVLLYARGDRGGARLRAARDHLGDDGSARGRTALLGRLERSVRGKVVEAEDPLHVAADGGVDPRRRGVGVGNAAGRKPVPLDASREGSLEAGREPLHLDGQVVGADRRDR
jgi:hypothetical protein